MSNVKSQRINMEYVNLMKLKINWSIVTLNTNSKKTYLNIAISFILYASTAMNANADSCIDYTVTDICEQSKYAAGEFHNIKLGDGVTAGSESPFCL